MKMISMANKEKEKGKSEGCHCKELCGCEMEKPRYPYGLQIYLEGEQLEKLGLSPEVGESMLIMCSVKVTRFSQEEMEKGEVSKGCSLQITEIGLPGKVSSINPDSLYQEAE